MANEGDIRPFVRYKYCTCARTKTKVIREPMVKEAYYRYLTVANEGDIRPFVRYKYCTCARSKTKVNYCHATCAVTKTKVICEQMGR